MYEGKSFVDSGSIILTDKKRNDNGTCIERDEQDSASLPGVQIHDCMCKHDTRVTRVGDFTRLDDDRARAPTRRASHLARRDARTTTTARAHRAARRGYADQVFNSFTININSL